MSEMEIATAMQGAGITMGVNAEKMRELDTHGIIKANEAMLEKGGKVTLTLTPKGGFDLSAREFGVDYLSSQTRTGHSTTTDNQTTMLEGTGTGDTVSSQKVTTNAGQVKELMDEGKVPLAIRSAQALGGLYKYDTTRGLLVDTTGRAGFSLAGFFGISTGVTNRKDIQESHKPMVGVYETIYNALEKEALHRGETEWTKHDWMAPEYAKIQDHILKQAAKVSAKDDGRASLRDMVNDYLKENQFTQAQQYLTEQTFGKLVNNRDENGRVRPVFIRPKGDE